MKRCTFTCVFFHFLTCNTLHRASYSICATHQIFPNLEMFVYAAQNIVTADKSRCKIHFKIDQFSKIAH